jgi:hypothetical protein
MRIEINNPALVDDLRKYLKRNGCPSIREAEKVIDIRVAWPDDALRFESVDRAKVLALLKDWATVHRGAQFSLLGERSWELRP